MGLTAQDDADRLQAHRAAYAHQVAVAAGLPAGSAVEAALAGLARERFLGPPPWRIVSPRGHGATTSTDAALLYQDVLVSLGGEPGLNNGQPSLHALCMAALDLCAGERVVHIGAGTGYYTAVLAALVGAAGRVDAFEIEADLAGRAQANLADLDWVQLRSRSGAEPPLPACDALYVNAAAAEPLAVWLDALRPGGRLLFPLAGRDGTGEMLLLTRDGAAGYAARFLGQVQFVGCIGAQEEQAAKAVAAAFRRGSPSRVIRLYRDSMPDESCWLAGRGWWLG